MKKNIFILISIVLAVAVIVLVFVSFVLPGLSTGKSSTPTPLTPPTMKLDLNFEDENDLKWVQFQSGESAPENSPQDALIDGAIRLGGENSFSSMGITYDLEPNQFVHFRTRSGGQTCGCTGLGKGLIDQSIGIRLETCTDSLYNVSVVFNRDNSGDSIFANLPKSGSVPGFVDEWIDEIIWLNESGDALYYFITNPNTPLQVMYGSVALPEDWQFDRWGIGVDGFYGVDENSKPLGYKDIDFIRVGSGSLQSYLTYSIPAYLENQAELDAFFGKPAAPMPELLPAPQQGGSQPEDENEPESEPETGQETGQEPAQEMAEGGEMNAGSSMLTWPQPESILPYLASLEKIERCDNCETTVYGVELSPFGYTFSVAFGFPPDSGATPRSSYIKHWIQIFTKTIDQEELLDYYRLHSRIQPYKAGEPIQFIYNNGGPESNLMLFEANVLTTASVTFAGGNYRSAVQIVNDAIATLPDEGLTTPEMAAEPALELNEEVAENLLDAAWLATFEDPSTPIFTLGNRNNLWVRLKAPVHRVETAIFHPGSQTYLTYSWMENPPVDVEIGMTGCVSTNDTTSPDGYYLGNYDGEFLIRVWADNQLVSEFSVEG